MPAVVSSFSDVVSNWLHWTGRDVSIELDGIEMTMGAACVVKNTTDENNTDADAADDDDDDRDKDWMM